MRATNMNRCISILIILSSIGFPANLLAEYKANEALQKRYENKIGEKPGPKASSEIRKRINTINTHINSREWKEEQHWYGRDLATAFDIADEDHDAPESQDISLERNEKLLLFISSSMPEHVVNRYAGDLAALNGVMVMRGGIDGIRKMKPTLEFIHRVLRKDRQCQGADCDLYPIDILIHPQLFAANDITRVPALMISTGNTLDVSCEQDHSGHTSKEADIIYGDATLAGMIEALYKMTGDSRLEPYLEKTHEK